MKLLSKSRRIFNYHHMDFEVPKIGRSSKRNEKRRMKITRREARRDHQQGCEYNIPSKEGLSKWKVRMKSLVEDCKADDHSGRSWTIHRVPANLVGIFKKAFIPKIISIGPFHFGHDGLQVMEEHKKRYFFRLLKGRLCNDDDTDVFQDQEDDAESSGGGNCISLDKLVNEMSLLEEKTRKSYSEEFNSISSDDFVKMMVVDGCFVVELLRLYRKFDSQEDIDDPIFTTRWMLRTLQRDMVMLENQLPFFVLEKIFELTSSSSSSSPSASSPSSSNDDAVPSLAELVLVFFDPLLPRETLSLSGGEEYDHILDVFRSTFLQSLKDKPKPPEWNPSDRNIPIIEERNLIHSATELQEANVRFKRKENQDLLDIKFENGVLEIPTLNIDDNSVPLFLNFLAYEQCDLDAKPFFTNYFVFLDSLINSQKDVEMLHQNGIINHVLGSDKGVAKIFHTVCREIVNDLDECYLSKVMTAVNDFCAAYNASTLYVWWMILKREYFSSPWPFISLLAAIFLLILTTLQTYYTMYPPK